MIDPIEVSIILPSLNRPQQLINTLDNIIATTRGINIEIITLLDEEDLTSQNLMGSRPYLKTPHDFRPVQSWNYGASLASGKWLYLGSDDTVHPPNWLRSCLTTPSQGYLGISDGQVMQGAWAPFYLVTRSWCKEYQGGVMCIPHYKHWGLDLECTARAVRSKTFHLAPIQLTHNHYLHKRSRRDSTYIRAEQYHLKDIALFKEREREGFPNDFEGYL